MRSSCEARCRPLVQYPYHLTRLLGLHPGGGEVLLYPQDLVDHVSLGLANTGEHTACGRINNLFNKDFKLFNFVVIIFLPAMSGSRDRAGA